MNRVWRTLAIITCLLCLLADMKAFGDSTHRVVKKVTYFSGYIRLSDATSEISKLSGVRIVVGSGMADWRVRDMPVVICANDIELGVLLRLIADTYYLSLSVTEVDGIPVYRLRRPKVYQDELNAYGTAINYNADRVDEFRLNALEWAGSISETDADALYQYVVKKNPQFGSDYGDSRLAFDEVILYGRLVSAIGDEERSNLLKGQEVVLSAHDQGYIGTLVKDYINLKCKIIDALRSGHTDVHSITADINQAEIRFRLSGINGYTLDSTASAGPLFTTNGFHGDLLSFTRISAPELLPRSPVEPTIRAEYLKTISIKAETNADPRLASEYVIVKPEKNEYQYADLLESISKATGYTIIADDYQDHKSSTSTNFGAIFSSKKSLISIIKQLQSRGVCYLDMDRKLLSIKDPAWAYRYVNLIPKTVFIGWLSKAKMDGLDLADYLAARQMTQGQLDDWVTGVNDLSTFLPSGLTNQQNYLWSMIVKLSASDIKRAMISGVRVTSLDTNCFMRFIAQLPDASKPQDDITQLWLRIVRDDSGGTTGKYSVKISGKRTSLILPLGVSFPIHSPKRQDLH